MEEIDNLTFQNIFTCVLGWSRQLMTTSIHNKKNVFWIISVFWWLKFVPQKEKVKITSHSKNARFNDKLFDKEEGALWHWHDLTQRHSRAYLLIRLMPWNGKHRPIKDVFIAWGIVNYTILPYVATYQRGMKFKLVDGLGRY